MEPDKRVAVVTGASSGFGKATASLLAAHGFRVFGTSRTPRADRGDGFELLELDVDSDVSVYRCVKTVLEKAGPAEVLVNNAGQVLTGSIEETSAEEAKAHFDTNFFGAVRMTRAVLPSMRERRRGCIVNIGSLAGTFPVPFEGYYAAAKAALRTYTQALRLEVARFNIHVSIVEPGFFKTNIGNARKVAAKPLDAYSRARERVDRRLEEHMEKGADPRKVAKRILGIVEDPNPRLRYPVGKERRYLLLAKITPAAQFEAGLRRHWQLDR
ncbi:MAG TPA: SDR family NAD(P)-dependent oxidoreductase [Thermoplasmata archaeon]|nr:SDR family NAD(P)-dependent oxidoreductase [Thermoplasmata archaeon]